MVSINSLRLLATLGLTTFVASTPLNSRSSVYPRQDKPIVTVEPCAEIFPYIREHPAANPKVPAQLAFDCLNTIPLNASSATALLDAIKPYVNWQTTLAWLKDPPAEYVEKVQEPVDVFAGLDKIAANVAQGNYTSEYQFGVALYSLFASTHDGHFQYYPDSVAGLFSWGRPLALVSVSEDGQKLPAVFAYYDVVNRHFANVTYTPSAIVKINDVETVQYLEKISQVSSLQDRDAAYNNLFYSLPQISLESSGSGPGTFAGSGRGRFVYPGAQTKLTFENGTETVLENFARPLVRFNGITNGSDVADKFLAYDEESATEDAPVQVDSWVERTKSNGFGFKTTLAHSKRQDAPDTILAPAPGYPSPIVQVGNVISGYYLEGEGYDDVAVLSVPSFVSAAMFAVGFQRAGDQFIAAAKAAGKTKLIIDVHANGGGTILQGYDLFKKLFPSILPYGASRFRALDDIDSIGKAFSDYSAPFPRNIEEINDSNALDAVSSYFNYRTDADVDYKPWESWAAKFGPHESHGDRFTSLTRWNLSDPLTPVNSGGINVTGYNSRENYTEQPFESNNVLVITDGYCASTCAIFAEMMRQQAGIKFFAFGGRANTDPIQAVGGTKGSNSFSWGIIQNIVQEAVNFGASRAGGLGAYFNSLPFLRAAGNPAVNNRDGLRQNDTTLVPLQFLYEPADCRIFYTPQMTIDVTAIWKAAADTQWNGNSKCVDAGPPMPYFARREFSKRLPQPLPMQPRDGMTRERLLDSLSVYTDLSDMDHNVQGFMMP